MITINVVNKRCKEFLSNLGRGKTIYECESENDKIDEEMVEGEK